LSLCHLSLKLAILDVIVKDSHDVLLFDQLALLIILLTILSNHRDIIVVFRGSKEGKYLVNLPLDSFLIIEEMLVSLTHLMKDVV
jgi:hypothetical protein